MRKNTDLSLDNLTEVSLVGSGHDDLTQIIHEQSCYLMDQQRILKKLALVKAMAQLSSSGVTIYDAQQGKHIYTSGKFYEIFGYEIPHGNEFSNEAFDEKVHPLDLPELGKNGNKAFEFILSVPHPLRTNYKIVNEYRISSKPGIYIRVIEQHQILQLDCDGNVALSLGVIDISPNQSKPDGVKSQILNFATGELVQIPSQNNNEMVKITRREKEILEMIRDGLLSKEISGLLAISIHTVNTHRQNILEKLGADNAIEALQKAKTLSLIS